MKQLKTATDSQSSKQAASTPLSSLRLNFLALLTASKSQGKEKGYTITHSQRSKLIDKWSKDYCHKIIELCAR